VKVGPSIELDKPAGLQGKELEELERRGKSPFNEERDPPPQIGGWHAWGITKWGKKAGTWGQGPEGPEERKKE
jgi:protein AFG1